MRRTNMLNLYRQRLGAEQGAADRADLARLLAKYGQDAPAADPGILRTVLVPMNRPAPTQPSRQCDDAGQLALGFG